jgi:hypothetical protein
MPASNTYEPIATTTLTSAVPSVTFGSIPQTYTDLILVVAGESNAVDVSIALVFNSDTATNYSTTGLSGNGSAASSFRETNTSYTTVGSMSTGQNNSIMHIMNYSNSTTNKTVLGRGNVSTQRTRLYAGLWRSTAAITSVNVRINDGTTLFSIGSTFTLYGIKAA